MKLVVTCEHAFNAIPKEYFYLFKGATEVLETHRGYDPGAFDLYNKVSKLANFGMYQKKGRLLVEVNRSENHPQLFSEFTKVLSKSEKEKILRKYYFPYRNAVEAKISEYTEVGEEIWHFSVHSFTPVLNGVQRNADIGLLYDPSRTTEKDFSVLFKKLLNKELPELKIRYNYPYLGKADGFTTYLRRKFPKNYSGIELEVNQKFVQDNKIGEGLKMAIIGSLKATWLSLEK
ncbi:N-formylglutamate amidohydrolase [Salegentibacter sp. F188]|uniref:N-formylglutamate amidohydrolase n=1 Tax=Autumnicola patrickiae TaxID=3075591 RepID=A0ABU3E291_9FLAO|nr:N-formylglutamate amidohydrolase [Salegentibacter sp. F188]MDT0690110.1 N-formylglutamate amidohydrolase [Salegentibacter sp. F188]